MTTIILNGQRDEDTYLAMNFDISDGNDVIGEASVMSSETGAYVERIDIDEAFRNMGHGTEALRALSDRFGGIYLAPDNEDAQRLYERIGSEYHGENADYIDQGYGVYEI